MIFESSKHFSGGCPIFAGHDQSVEAEGVLDMRDSFAAPNLVQFVPVRFVSPIVLEALGVSISK